MARGVPCVLLFFFDLITVGLSAKAPVVNTTTGQISGIFKGDVAGFLGIPFATSPTGNLRFKLPTAHPEWNGTLSTTTKPSICLQGVDNGSDDCLFLNAFTPAGQLAKGAPLRPVMVYIHGGGFVSGSAAEAWNFTHLTGHVVFAPQYRLGVLGFLSTTHPPPNLGLADQRFALQWVRDNAKAFGGDPTKIMIYGCSAGGASVAGMLTMPEAYGMYTAAGIESPGGHQGWMGGTVRTDDDWMSTNLNLNNSRELAMTFGCSGSDDLPCLQSVGLQSLYKQSKELRFAPAMRSEGLFPLGQIRRGEWNKVPVIVGGQSCESCRDAFAAFGAYSRTGVTRDAFRAALSKAGFSGTHGSAVGPDTLESWYQARIAKEGYWRTFARILSDSGHACSSTLHAEALAGSANGSVWRYFFAYSTDAALNYGATHGGDESWLMDEHEDGTAGEVQLSREMAFWWASLNSNGDPNAARYSNAPYWTPYNPGTNPSSSEAGASDVVESQCRMRAYWVSDNQLHVHA